MFKGLANFASMIKQAQQLGGKLQGLSEELRGKRVTGTSGGGLIEAEVNGLGELLRVRIDPQLSVQNDREMIEDLLPAAVNQALVRAKELHAEAMKSLTQGMNLPGLDEALAKLREGGDASGE